MNYTRLMRFLEAGNKFQFDIPVEEQQKYLDSFSEPKNDIRRSFCQYKCQMFFVARFKILALNFISFWILWVFILLAYIKRARVRFLYSCDAIVERSSHQGVIPDSLKKKYTLSSDEWSDGFSFGIRDLPFILRTISYVVRSPYFVLKVLYKAALYSTMIKEYQPKAIVVYNEYSFTSSALTAFCESNGVEHIDVMHGEKLFYIRDSFFRFTKTYVWEEYYARLFSRLRAPQSQFIAETPPFMRTDTDKHRNPAAYADYKYYLALYDENSLQDIIRSLAFIKEKGCSLKFRPHPRYSDMELLRKYVPENQIEYPREVGIEDSVSNLGYGIGVFTTVLNQCFHAGKRVIIDDINFPEQYSLLAGMGYALLEKPVELLSRHQ